MKEKEERSARIEEIPIHKAINKQEIRKEG
jgi:hypothetical protein